MMTRFQFCVIWLKIVSVLFSIFGVVIALLNQTPVFQVLFNNQINPTFWTGADAVLPAGTLHFQQWIYGLLGATCVMVGVLIYFIVHNAFAKKEKWAWQCLLFALCAWFIIDEPVSLYFRVYFNAVFNLVLLLSVLLPLCVSAREF